MSACLYEFVVSVCWPLFSLLWLTCVCLYSICFARTYTYVSLLCADLCVFVVCVGECVLCMCGGHLMFVHTAFPLFSPTYSPICRLLTHSFTHSLSNAHSPPSSSPSLTPDLPVSFIFFSPCLPLVQFHHTPSVPPSLPTSCCSKRCKGRENEELVGWEG